MSDEICEAHDLSVIKTPKAKVNHIMNGNAGVMAPVIKSASKII